MCGWRINVACTHQNFRLLSFLLVTALILAMTSDIRVTWTTRFEQPKISPFENNYATLTGHGNGVTSIAFSPDDTLLASGSFDGTMRIWNISTGGLIHVLRHQRCVFGVAFSPSGMVVASSGYYFYSSSNVSLYDGYIKLWNVTTGNLLHVLGGKNQSYSGLAFSPDGKLLAVGGGKGDVGVLQVFNLTSRVELYNRTEHGSYIQSVAFSPDGLTLATSGYDKTVKLWSGSSGVILHTLNSSDEVTSLAFSPDGTKLAGGCRDGSIAMWNPSSGSFLYNVTGSQFKVWSVDFSPDGSLLASGDGERNTPSQQHNATIRLLDVDTKEEKVSLTGHTDIINSVVFSHDGTRLASASWDWTIKLWGDYELIPSKVDNQWPTSIPEEQGMSSPVLNALLDTLDQMRSMNVHSIHGLVIVRHGTIVTERYYNQQSNYHQYTQNDKHQLFSVTKSITSALIGIAIDHGFIENVNQKVLDFFPDKDFSNVDPRKESMTLEHLLTMTTGLHWPEWEIGYENPDDLADAMLFCEDSVEFILNHPMEADPGTVFNYNSGASHILSHIIQRVTGMSTLEFAQQYLFNPLSITPGDVVWDTDLQGVVRGHSNLYLSPRNMAKIGQLYLDNGVWNGTQVISTEWITNSTTNQIETFVGGYYGYQWWINWFPVSPRARPPIFDGYAASGLNGQYICVLPGYDMVVVFTECSWGIPHLQDYIVLAITDEVLRLDPAIVLLGSSLTCSVGESFTLAAQIDNVENLEGINLKIQWDTNYLEYVTHLVTVPGTSHSGGLLYNPILWIQNEVNTFEGWYALAVTSTHPMLFSGSGKAFEITFKVKNHPVEPEPDMTFLIMFTVDTISCWGSPIPHATENCTVTITSSTYAHLKLDSSPSGVPFIVNDIIHFTPWIGNFQNGEVVNLEMPEFRIDNGRYSWSGWNDGENNRSRIITMKSDIMLIANYEQLDYDLNSDGIIDITDIKLAATDYGAKPLDSYWDPYVDVAPPWNLIDIFDLVTIASHYGKT